MTPNAGAGSRAPTAIRISRSRTCRSASTASRASAPRGGVAIGDEIFDLKIAREAGLFSGEAKRAADAAGGSRLNGLFALGAGPRAALRARLSELLDADGPERQAGGRHEAARSCSRAADCAMHLPARIGDFTDFFAGIHHATNAGRLLRPDNPLLPNYKHIPVAYHGRASSIRVSGTPTCGGRTASASRRPRPSRTSGRAAISTTSSSSASGSGRATHSARRSRSARRASTSPASACSTTGRRATSRPGSTSRSVRSWPRISPRRCRPGW